MWDTFHRNWICALTITCFAVLLATCTSCTMTSKKSPEAKLVDEISENCKHGLSIADVHQEEDERDVRVQCAGPPRVAK